MYSLNEISTKLREYTHSRLINDTGIIFLELEKYERHGYLRYEESGSSTNTRRLNFSVPSVAALSTMAILALLATYSSNKIQKPDSSKPNPINVTLPEKMPDVLEEKIQYLSGETVSQGIPDIVSYPKEFDTKTSQGPKIKSGIYDAMTPTPEEIVYVNTFKSFLEAHLRSKGFIFPKPEEMNRTCQLPHAYYISFTINESGIVQPKNGAASSIPPCLPNENYWSNWLNSVDKYYNQLFSNMPKFIPSSDRNLAAPYTIDLIGVFNALTRDGNRVYWFSYESEELYQDFDLGKLKVISPKPIHKD